MNWMKLRASRESTRELVIALEKKAKKEKAGIWKKAADRINSPTRRRAEANLWQLNAVGKKFKGKILLLPGKVLGKGSLDSPLHIIALAFSEEAKKKILKAKGKAALLSECLEKKIEKKDLALVE